MIDGIEVFFLLMCDGHPSTWMSRWKLGSMVRINGLFHPLINGVFLGVCYPTDPNL